MNFKMDFSNSAKRKSFGDFDRDYIEPIDHFG